MIIHSYLCRKQKWYKKWHENKYHLHVHAAILVLFVTFMSFSSWLSHRTTRADSNVMAMAVTSGSQEDQQSISDGSGGIFMVWQDSRSGTHIYAQRVNSSKQIQWTLRVSNDSIEANNTDPQLVSDGSGGMMVLWRRSTGSLLVQRINSNGVAQLSPSNDGVAITTASNLADSPQLISDGSGNYIAAWDDSRLDAPGIYVQKFDPTGAVFWTDGGVRISNQGGSTNQELKNSQPALVKDGTGGAIITWVRNVGADGLPPSDIYAQRLNNGGNAQWASGGVVVTNAPDSQNQPKIIGDGTIGENGQGSVIAWGDYRNGSSLLNIYAQYLNSSGAAQLAANGVRINTVATGSFDFDAGYIGWTSTSGAYLQAITASGQPQWSSDVQLSSDSGADNIDVVFDSATGEVMAAYNAGNPNKVVYLHRVNSVGTKTQWGSSGIAPNPTGTSQIYPRITPNGSGGAIMIWNEGAFQNYDIYGEFISIPASNATLYVDTTNGTNKGSCGTASGASACKTIQYAVTLAVSNNTISAASGTYDETISLGSKNLTLNGNNVATITDTSRANADSGVMVIDATAVPSVIRNFTITANDNTPLYAIKIPDGAGTLIENNTIQNSNSSSSSHYAVIADSGSVNTATPIIRNNTIIGTNGASGIYIIGNATVDSNTILSGRGMETIGATGYNATITLINNVIYSTGTNGEVGLGLQDTIGRNTTYVVANNTIYKKNTGIYFRDTNTGTSGLTAYVKNNIIAGNTAGLGIEIYRKDADAVTLTSNYNVIHVTTGTLARRSDVTGAYTNYATLAAWQSASGQDLNSVASDPKFSNAGSADFTLQNTSPAVGTGTNNIVGTNDLATYSLNLDKNDATRPYSSTRVDAGAYETSVGDLTSITLSATTTTLNTGAPSTVLTAVGNYNVGSSETISSSVTYSSTDTTKVVIGNTSKIARGKGTGSANITAALNGVTSNTLTISTSGLPEYVSLYADAASGDDTSGTGSNAAPYKTLSAIENEISGTTYIYLKGIFSGALHLTSAMAGLSDSNNTWVTTWPNESATISSSGNSGVYALWLDNADYVTVQGLTLTGATNTENGGGIIIGNGSDNINLSGNTFQGNAMGILNDTLSTGGRNHTYSTNKIYNNTMAGAVLSNNTNVSLLNNLIYKNRGGIVQVGVSFVGTSSGINLWNNTLVNHPGGNLAFYDTGEGNPTVTNLTVKNNLMAQTTANYSANVKMINAINTGSGNTFDYNLYYATNGVPLVTVDNTNYNSLSLWQSASTHDSNSVNNDPVFTNLATDDYRVQDSSGAVNKGTPDSASGLPSGVSTDILGTLRNSRYDIGAYETTVSVSSGSSVSQTQRLATYDAKFTKAKVKIKVNFGEHRNQNLIKTLNSLKEGSLEVAAKDEIQKGLKKLFGDKKITLESIQDNDSLQKELLSIDAIGEYLKGQRSERLILEIWEADSHSNLLASVNVSTDIWGEGTTTLPALPENSYDFTIRKPFGVRLEINGLSLAKEMTLDFSGKRLRTGDLNGDGIVDSKDFGQLLQKAKSGKLDTANYDFNEDGVLDIYDFSEILQNLK